VLQAVGYAVMLVLGTLGLYRIRRARKPMAPAGGRSNPSTPTPWR